MLRLSISGAEMDLFCVHVIAKHDLMSGNIDLHQSFNKIVVTFFLYFSLFDMNKYYTDQFASMPNQGQ